jgi:hypothetical protein
MACTGTEEECRRRCIIDPAACGIGNAPVSQVSGLAEELSLHCPEEVNFHHLAAHLLRVFKFSAAEVVADVASGDSDSIQNPPGLS